MAYRSLLNCLLTLVFFLAAGSSGLMLESKDSFITPCYLMTPYHRQQSLVLLRRQGSCRLIVCFSFASRKKSIECRLLRMRSSLVFSSDFCSGVQSLYILPSGWRFFRDQTQLCILCAQGHLWCILKPWTTFQMMQSSPRCKKFATCAASTKGTQAPHDIPGESNAALLFRAFVVGAIFDVSHDLDELPKCAGWTFASHVFSTRSKKQGINKENLWQPTSISSIPVTTLCDEKLWQQLGLFENRVPQTLDGWVSCSPLEMR